jgi:hypothetical protein
MHSARCYYNSGLGSFPQPDMNLQTAPQTVAAFQLPQKQAKTRSHQHSLCHFSPNTL